MLYIYYIYIYFCVYEYFAYMNVCASHVFLVPMEIRSGCQIPWN